MNKNNPSHQEWFTLKGTYKYGPFTHQEIVHMLQEKLIFEYDLVWNKSLTTWSRISELQDFTPEAIEQVKLKSQQGNKHFRRKYRRVKYQNEVFIHDGQKMWTGNTVEISPGGTGLFMTEAKIEVGTEVHLHFKPGADVPPFNAVCRVINLNSSSRPGVFRYGLEFISIENKIYKLLERFSKAKEAA